MQGRGRRGVDRQPRTQRPLAAVCPPRRRPHQAPRLPATARLGAGDVHGGDDGVPGAGAVRPALLCRARGAAGGSVSRSGVGCLCQQRRRRRGVPRRCPCFVAMPLLLLRGHAVALASWPCRSAVAAGFPIRISLQDASEANAPPTPVTPRTSSMLLACASHRLAPAPPLSPVQSSLPSPPASGAAPFDTPWLPAAAGTPPQSRASALSSHASDAPGAAPAAGRGAEPAALEATSTTLSPLSEASPRGNRHLPSAGIDAVPLPALGGAPRPGAALSLIHI